MREEKTTLSQAFIDQQRTRHEQRSLARGRRRHEVEGEDAVCVEMLAIMLGGAIVCVEHGGADESREQRPPRKSRISGRTLTNRT